MTHEFLGESHPSHGEAGFPPQELSRSAQYTWMLASGRWQSPKTAVRDPIQINADEQERELHRTAQRQTGLGL